MRIHILTGLMLLHQTRNVGARVLEAGRLKGAAVVLPCQAQNELDYVLGMVENLVEGRTRRPGFLRRLHCQNLLW